MKILFILFISVVLGANELFKIKILDIKEINISGVYELSALAYDGKILYALSDAGILHFMSIDIKHDKITSIKLLKSKKLKKKKVDSEGMVLVGDELYISFERKPKVVRYSLNGKKIKKYKIPKILRDIKNYQGKNKALESIAYHKNYGILVAPEIPLRGEDEDYHIIYAKHKRYKFKASGSLSAIEFIKSGELMTLERDFSFFSFNRVITLSRVYLSDLNICKKEILAILKTTDGYELDNFEGLTKLDKNRYLMVSDDNHSAFQKTLFVLFELVNPN